MAAEAIEAMESTSAAASVAFQVRSSWQAIQGQIDSVMDVILDSGDPSAESSTSIVAAGDLDLSLAPPPINPGPCEITVEFQHRLCHVHSICVLSSSRQCEIYSQAQSAGNFDYICTARGTLLKEGCSSGETGQLYEAEIELVNAHPWAAVKIRLLSLENPSRANVRKITVRGSAGGAPPTLAAREDEQGSFSSNSSNSSSLLTMLMPSVLQAVRGMSDGMETRRAAARVPQKIEAGPSKEAELSRQHAETSFRLQRLEMVIGRMEAFLQGAFSKLDNRMSSMEAQISTLQQQRLESRDVPASEMRQPSPSSDARPDVPVDEAEHSNTADLREDEGLDEDGDGDDEDDDEEEEEDQEEEDDNDESSPSLDGSGESSSGSLETDSTTARRGSLSLEDAWASALAAFSVSVVPAAPGPEEKFEDAVAEVNAERPADSNGDIGEEKEERNGELEPGGGDATTSGWWGEFIEVPAAQEQQSDHHSRAEGVEVLVEQQGKENAQEQQSQHHSTAEGAEVLIEQQGKENAQEQQSQHHSTAEGVEVLIEQQGKEKSDGNDPAPVGMTATGESAGSREVDLIDFDEQEPRKSNFSSGDCPGGFSPDSLLIDCIDGVYLMEQKKMVPQKGGSDESVEDGFDLIASPRKVDPEICTDLMF
ncbi:histone-lysine N-methyltransferase SETD1B-like [Selaginella moellendorffii]|uniref:histone-lysine N-methyltransferase SETD1B-like n=1 Tax=Selaginella moellendorffii TaxID=88036 RepID=UPI000D1CA3C3|nr:histone-lysine N-methyltransferase SETD1B-like [Selaginella moellendorffii]|eukprot:XP_024544978.1 histone-lysine N-methyltransferase SETD1B-like [Selaginella moellendorffii]